MQISARNILDRPTIANLSESLADLLTASLGRKFSKLQISLLSQASHVADGTTVFLVRDAAGESRAVALCSAPASAELVKRAMDCARQAKAMLGPSLGESILDTLAEGSVCGLSYAVLPYCDRLSDTGPAWWIQRALLRGPVLEWLWRLTERTIRKVDRDDIARQFAAPLEHVATHNLLDIRLRRGAELAVARLLAGTWSPRYVLMHGDLWKGNILLRPARRTLDRLKRHHRFVVIDWPGSLFRGYAMFDLVRLAQSMRVGRRQMHGEVDRHCRLLRCDPADAMSYLLAAIGNIGMNLEHFPVDRFTQMADSSVATLERALD